MYNSTANESIEAGQNRVNITLDNRAKDRLLVYSCFTFICQ